MLQQRIIFVNARFLTQPLTGVQRYAFEISMQLKNLCDNIVFLAPNNIIHKEWAFKLNVKTLGFTNGHLWEQTELPLFLLKQKKFILVSLGNTGPSFVSNQVLTLHDLAFLKNNKYQAVWFRIFYIFCIPILIRRCKYIFTVSNFIQQEIENTYPISKGKISVTYNGVGEYLLRQSRTRINTIKDKIVLCVGSLSKRKNVDLLAKAFIASELCKQQYQLIYIGCKELKHVSPSIPTHPQIKVLPNLDDLYLSKWYLKSEFVVNLSSYEGFGIPIFEALAFNCKVLCSDIPVFRELYEGLVSFTSLHSIDYVVASLNKLPMGEVKFQQFKDEIQTKYNYLASAKSILKTISEL